MTTYNTGNALGSVDVRDLYDNAQNLDNFANGPLNFYTDRLGVSRESLRGIRNASQYQIIGDYGAGLVFTSYNQTFGYLGEFYAPSAGLTLPYTTTGAGAGEISSFRSVGDAILRSDLAASDGAEIIGLYEIVADMVSAEPTLGKRVKTTGKVTSSDGLGAEYIVTAGAASYADVAFSGGNYAKKITLSNYTVVSPSANVIASDIAALSTPNSSVVVTGDSLGFNGFGYPASWGVNGGDYATNQLFGLSSWASLIRDTYITGGYYLPFDMHRFVMTGGYSKTPDSDQRNTGINSRTTYMNFTSAADTCKFYNPYTGSGKLLVSYAPAGRAVSFDVDGVTYSNLSPTGNYKGYGYMMVPINSTSVNTVTNVTKAGGGVAEMFFYGVVNSDTPTVTNSSKGAWNSAQILAEYSTLVTPYNPDIIFYIIGANDAVLGDPAVSGFNSNVQAFINNAKASKPNVVVVLLSMPATSSFSGVVIKEYLDAGRELAIKNACSFVDLYSETVDIPASLWRFDNIHANTYGDTLWYSIIKKHVFSPVVTEGTQFIPVREALLGGSAYPVRAEFTTTFLCSASSPTEFGVSDPVAAGGIKSVYNLSTNNVEMTLPYGYTFGSLSLIGSATTRYINVTNIGGTSVAFQLISRATDLAVSPDASGVFFTIGAVPG